MTLMERVEFAKRLDQDIIMVKDGQYMSGKWDEREYAEECGFEFVGTVDQLWLAAQK